MRPGERDEFLSAYRIITYERDSLPPVNRPDATRHPKTVHPHGVLVGLIFSCRLSADDHLRIESSKNNTSKATWGWRVKGFGQSGRIRQSCVCALGRAGVRDGDDTGHPLASRELDRIPPHLHDMRNCARWT